MTIVTTDVYDNELFTRVITTQANGTPISETKQMTPNVRNYRVKDSIKTPNFVFLKRTKNLPEQPYSLRIERTTYPRGLIRETGKNGGAIKTIIGSMYGNFYWSLQKTSFGPSTFDLSGYYAQVITDLRLKLKDQKVNLLQMQAERLQTASLLTTSAYRLSTAFTLMRKGLFGNASSVLKRLSSSDKTEKQSNRRQAALALLTAHADPSKGLYTRKRNKAAISDVGSLWLEIQYGWKPLLSDVYGTAELLAQKYMFERKSYASKMKKFVITEVIKTPVPENLQVPYTTVSNRRCETIVKYRLYFSDSMNPTLHTMAQTGYSNPLYIAWELLPFSFVVDWFIPIGSYVNSLDSTLGLNFHKGSRTTFIRDTVVTEIFPRKSTSASTPDGMGYASGKFEFVSMKRERITTFPFPSYPSFKNPVTPMHLANAIALMTLCFSSGTVSVPGTNISLKSSRK